MKHGGKLFKIPKKSDFIRTSSVVILSWREVGVRISGHGHKREGGTTLRATPEVWQGRTFIFMGDAQGRI